MPKIESSSTSRFPRLGWGPRAHPVTLCVRAYLGWKGRRHRHVRSAHADLLGVFYYDISTTKCGPGQRGILWFQGGRISHINYLDDFLHLLRHVYERSYYCPEPTTFRLQNCQNLPPSRQLRCRYPNAVHGGSRYLLNCLHVSFPEPVKHVLCPLQISHSRPSAAPARLVTT